MRHMILPSSHRLDCDEECAQMERNRKLAEALELDVDHTPHTPPQYSSFLLDQAKSDSSLVSHVEETFRNLIESFKTSTGRAAISHHFKPMKRDQRRLIHELAEVYQLSSLSYDSEPKRNVVVMATQWVEFSLHIFHVKTILYFWIISY